LGTIRFLWERLGTAFPHLSWPWERLSHTYLNLNKAQDGFRDFVDSEERNPISPFLQGIDLTSAVSAIPIISPDAERDFKTMNTIATPQKQISRATSVEFDIREPGWSSTASFQVFNPMPDFTNWLTNPRLASDNQSKCLGKLT